MLAIFFWAAQSVWPSAAGPLTTLRAIHALSNSEASQALPVAFPATVTYYRNNDEDLFVQMDGVAIYVSLHPGAELLPGDRVLVRGKTEGSFRPDIVDASVTVLSHGGLPAAIPASFNELVSAKLDCLRVRLNGVVRSADLVGFGDKRSLYLNLLTGKGYVDVAVNSNDQDALKRLLDAKVEIEGIATAKFDQKMQIAGVRIDVQSLADVKVRQAPPTLAEIPRFGALEDVLQWYEVRDLSRRIWIRGTITYYQPGTTLVLQSGSKSLGIETLSSEPLRIGDIAEVTGFPDVRKGYLSLTHAEVHDTGIYSPIPPVVISWRELGFGGNALNRVVIEAKVLRQVRQSAMDEYVLDADGHVFSAIYRHPVTSASTPPPALKTIAVGSKVQVTGIGMFYSPDPFNGPVASDLMLQSLDDIVVVAKPSLVTKRNLLLTVGLLLVAVFFMSLRGWFLERKMRHHAAALAARVEADAQWERQRSEILEAINGSVPMTEILSMIAAMVSFRLDGTPCWGEVAEGTHQDRCPSDYTGLRIQREEIRSSSGTALGSIAAAFDPKVSPNSSDSIALLAGARIASVAIETRRLNEALHRRSEFDLLTDIHNRFSLEERLGTLIAGAEARNEIFGLIYIDLDNFKQVNDLYGHHIGDSYLQEATRRMKHQLRSSDFLARLGGDEFAVLVPVLKDHSDVEEIASRLRDCFNNPFVVDIYILHGSASIGIAYYPEDGRSKDGLLRAADDAMYAAKGHARRA